MTTLERTLQPWAYALARLLGIMLIVGGLALPWLVVVEARHRARHAERRACAAELRLAALRGELLPADPCLALAEIRGGASVD